MEETIVPGPNFNRPVKDLVYKDLLTSTFTQVSHERGIKTWRASVSYPQCVFCGNKFRYEAFNVECHMDPNIGKVYGCCGLQAVRTAWFWEVSMTASSSTRHHSVYSVSSWANTIPFLPSSAPAYIVDKDFLIKSSHISVNICSSSHRLPSYEYHLYWILKDHPCPHVSMTKGTYRTHPSQRHSNGNWMDVRWMDSQRNAREKLVSCITMSRSKEYVLPQSARDFSYSCRTITLVAFVEVMSCSLLLGEVRDSVWDSLSRCNERLQPKTEGSKPIVYVSYVVKCK